MDQVDDLSGSSCPLRTTSTWDYGVGPLHCSLVRWLFRRQLYLGLIAGLGPPTPVVGGGSASPASHVLCRSTKGRGSKVPLCLGFRPADGLSVELEGWTSAYRIASVGNSLTRCTPPWRSERVV